MLKKETKKNSVESSNKANLFLLLTEHFHSTFYGCHASLFFMFGNRFYGIAKVILILPVKGFSFQNVLCCSIRALIRWLMQLPFITGQLVGIPSLVMERTTLR